jgi:hypothetical protein
VPHVRICAGALGNERPLTRSVSVRRSVGSAVLDAAAFKLVHHPQRCRPAARRGFGPVQRVASSARGSPKWWERGARFVAEDMSQVRDCARDTWQRFIERDREDRDIEPGME